MEQEIKKIAELFKVAREEGAITKWANGVVDAEQVMDIIRQAGYRLPPEQTDGEVSLCGGLLIGKDLYEEDGYYFLTETARKRLVNQLLRTI